MNQSLYTSYLGLRINIADKTTNDVPGNDTLVNRVSSDFPFCGFLVSRECDISVIPSLLEIRIAPPLKVFSSSVIAADFD